MFCQNNGQTSKWAGRMHRTLAMYFFVMLTDGSSDSSTPLSSARVGKGRYGCVLCLGQVKPTVLLLFYSMERLWALHDVLVAWYCVKESHLGVLFVFRIVSAVCTRSNLHTLCIQAVIFVLIVEAYALCFLICSLRRLTIQCISVSCGGY